MNDNIMFHTTVKILTQKSCPQSFIISKFLLAQNPVKLRNFNFFQVFVQIFGIHIIQKIMNY